MLCSEDSGRGAGGVWKADAGGSGKVSGVSGLKPIDEPEAMEARGVTSLVLRGCCTPLPLSASELQACPAICTDSFIDVSTSAQALLTMSKKHMAR